MIRVLLVVFFFGFTLLGLSQTKESPSKTEKSKIKLFHIELSTFNDYPVFATTYVFDNNLLSEKGSLRESKGNLTFRRLLCINNNSINTPDTIKVTLTPQQGDSLFTLTSKFFSAFQRSMAQVSEKEAMIVNDDVQVKVVLSDLGREMTATVNSVSSLKGSRTELKRLLTFLRKFNQALNQNSR